MAAGVLTGLNRGAWKGKKMDIVLCETDGMNCMNAALKNGSPIMLDKVTGIATSLGARKVSQGCFDLLTDFKKRGGGVHSELVSDKESV